LFIIEDEESIELFWEATLPQDIPWNYCLQGLEQALPLGDLWWQKRPDFCPYIERSPE
jgi:hypothetical protein